MDQVVIQILGLDLQPIYCTVWSLLTIIAIVILLHQSSTVNQFTPILLCPVLKCFTSGANSCGQTYAVAAIHHIGFLSPLDDKKALARRSAKIRHVSLMRTIRHFNLWSR